MPGNEKTAVLDGLLEFANVTRPGPLNTRHSE